MVDEMDGNGRCRRCVIAVLAACAVGVWAGWIVFEHVRCGGLVVQRGDRAGWIEVWERDELVAEWQESDGEVWARLDEALSEAGR